MNFLGLNNIIYAVKKLCVAAVVNLITINRPLIPVNKYIILSCRPTNLLLSNDD